MFLQNHAEQLIILSEPEKLQGGEKVRVIGGEYAGVEGEIYHIKGHKKGSSGAIRFFGCGGDG